jgi:beta-phosphoglucomutase-like phosphatase (HAD superfamily)
MFRRTFTLISCKTGKACGPSPLKKGSPQRSSAHTSKREDFELIHRGRSILKYMDFVLTVEDYSRAKPDPEPYLTALRRFCALPREAVAVEDSARGLKSAVSAGIDCIIVENEFTHTHDFSVAAAKVGSIRDLTILLSGE